MSEPGRGEIRKRQNDWDPKSEPEPVGVRMPKLYVIPAGTRAAQCGCGMYQYFVRDGDVTRSLSCEPTFYSKTVKGDVTVPGVKRPTSAEPGLGFAHHINCAQREMYKKKRSSADTPEQRAAKIRAAEELAAKHGIKCSGAPNVTDCNGDAVVAFLLAKKLFATPCSVHGDVVLLAIERAGRKREVTFHALDEFLTDRGADVAAQFAAKAKSVREWHNARGGLTVPKTGHL